MFFGEKAIYGKYKPLVFEVYADHMLLPIATITIAILSNCYTNTKESTKNTIMLGIFWILFTLYSGPAYPFLCNSDKTLNIPKLTVMVVCFGFVAIAFDGVCSDKNSKKDEK